MKLTCEDKVKIHELRKQEGDRLKWDVSVSIIRIKERLIRERKTLFNANLSQSNQWKSAIRMLQSLPFQQVAKTLFITSFRWF